MKIAKLNRISNDAEALAGVLFPDDSGAQQDKENELIVAAIEALPPNERWTHTWGGTKAWLCVVEDEDGGVQSIYMETDKARAKEAEVIAYL